MIVTSFDLIPRLFQPQSLGWRGYDGPGMA